MVLNTIKVFARLKSENKLVNESFEVIKVEEQYEDIVFYRYVDFQKEISNKFRFCQIFDSKFNQSDVFTVIAKPIIENVLQGYNGTIFAYGQTGSGKTYTMSGSHKNYHSRGITPRSLQYIFSTIGKTEDKPTVYVSYMEIYNEIGYDLLNSRNSKIATRLEELPRITVLEDSHNEVHIRNLSVLPVTTEEDAMRLFYLGDTNRVIAETPLNEYSSRSHCIFTIHITSKPKESQPIRYSKLNLVDLAGSERVYKSLLTGTILNEAKNINLSLHFLQQVILALSDQKRVHVPFRNSLMTLILKDSLGGNCQSVMLATLSSAKENLQETLSTCKFAQRVSLIQTLPIVNEIVDPYRETVLLRLQVEDLRKQLITKKQKRTSPLTKEEIRNCTQIVDDILKNKQQQLPEGLDELMIQHCFSIIRKLYYELKNEKDQILSQKIQGISLFSDHAKLQGEKKLDGIRQKEQEVGGPSGEQQLEEVSCYENLLTRTLEKAKLHAETIEECQKNINLIRAKLEVKMPECQSADRLILVNQLEYQQNIYRQSLQEMQTLKNETLQLEAGMKKASVKSMRERFNGDSKMLVTNCPIDNRREANNSFKPHCECLQCCKDLTMISPKCAFSGLSSEKYRGKSCCTMSHNPSTPLRDVSQTSGCFIGRNGLEPHYKESSAFHNHQTACIMCQLEDSKQPYRFQFRDLPTSASCPQKISVGNSCCALKSKLSNGEYCNEFCQYYQHNLNDPVYSGLDEDCIQLIPNRLCDDQRQRDGGELIGILPSINKNEKCSQGTQNCQFEVNCDCQLTEVRQSSSSNQEGGRGCFLPKINETHQEIRSSEIHLRNRDETARISNIQDHKLMDILPEITDQVTLDKSEIVQTCHSNEYSSSNGTTGLFKEERLISDQKVEIFLESDSKEFREFMNTIQLSGDYNLDMDICNFYRSKFV